MSQHKLVPDFKPSDPKKKDKKVQFINFGGEGEPFIVHIDNWDVYEMPALKDVWRSTKFIFDNEQRGIRINSIGFQEELKQFWGKKSSLVVCRHIDKDSEGKYIYSTTIYNVSQFNEAKLWDYKAI